MAMGLALTVDVPVPSRGLKRCWYSTHPMLWPKLNLSMILMLNVNITDVPIKRGDLMTGTQREDHVKNKEKMAIHEPKRQMSGGTNPANNLILDF